MEKSIEEDKKQIYKRTIKNLPEMAFIQEL